MNKQTDLAAGREFTFNISDIVAPTSDVLMPLVSTTSTTSHDKKRSQGHPDGPTPANSPQKKRVRLMAGGEEFLPHQLLFRSSAMLSSSPENGGTKLTTGKISDGTLFSFFSRESTEQTRERNLRDFEELRDTRDSRQLDDERTRAMRKDRQRANDRERQQSHRARVRDRKIANGWKTSQKRVSQLCL
jgi:hypothetical protein